MNQNQNQLSKNKMEQINHTISMISWIYEKFFQYSNECPHSVVFMKYSDLRDKIQSGWIYDNMDEFIALWNDAEIFCKPSRSSARQEMSDDMDFSMPVDMDFSMPVDMDFSMPVDTAFIATRSTADQYYPNITRSEYDELQGGDNTYGCSYNSYGGNVHVRELRPYSLGDENYPTSIINLSRDMEEGYQRQVSFVDNNDMEEGYQRQVSFFDNLLEDNNEEFQRQVSLNGNQTKMLMCELDLGSDDEDDDEMPELMDL